MEIRGKVVLVTGASTGIGAAVARAAAAAGARLVLAARRMDRLTELAAELPDALAVECDVTDPTQITRLVDAALERYDRVDVLVNNAGQGLLAPIEQIGLEDYEAILRLNLVAPLLLIQAVIPSMREHHEGSIVNISSGTTLLIPPGNAAYVSSKAALNALSITARKELAADGIAVSLVLPFVTTTEFHDVLRVGSVASGQVTRSGFQPQPPELVADIILRAIETGEERLDLVPRALGGSYDAPSPERS